MRRVAQLLTVIVAVLAVQLPAGAAESNCFGCGSRMIDDGYMCPTGDVVVHEGGFFMQGWYGYKNASHTAPMCGYCSVHNTCLWGAAEAEQAVQYALANGEGLAEVSARFADFIRVDESAGTLAVIGCDQKPVRVFHLRGEVAQT